MAGHKTQGQLLGMQEPPGRQRARHRRRWHSLAGLTAAISALAGTAINTAAAVDLWKSSCVPSGTSVNLLDPQPYCVGGVGFSPAQPTYWIGASPTKLSLQLGTSGTTTLTVMPQNGFQGQVTMAVAPAPDSPVTNAPPTATFSNGTPTTQSSSPYTGQLLTFSVPANALPGQYHFTVQAVAPTASQPFVSGDIYVQARTAPGLDDNSSCPSSGCNFVNRGTVWAHPRVFLIFWGSLWAQDPDGIIPALWA
jgi:hypothetical protein